MMQAHSHTTPILAHCQGIHTLCSAVRPFLQFTAKNKPTVHTRPLIAGSSSQENRVTSKHAPCFNTGFALISSTILLPILCELSCNPYRHPDATQGHLHTISPTKPRSTSHNYSTYCRDKTPFFSHNPQAEATHFTHLKIFPTKRPHT